MAKIFRLRSVAIRTLRKRKAALLARLSIPADAIRGSCVEQYLTCGKANCRCQRGRKHGPFSYFVQCLHTGRMQKFLLKTAGHKEQARVAVAAYHEFQESVEELSQINAELLRRGKMLRE